jgi:hypothetical protein
MATDSSLQMRMIERPIDQAQFAAIVQLILTVVAALLWATGSLTTREVGYPIFIFTDMAVLAVAVWGLRHRNRWIALGLFVYFAF